MKIEKDGVVYEVVKVVDEPPLFTSEDARRIIEKNNKRIAGFVEVVIPDWITGEMRAKIEAFNESIQDEIQSLEEENVFLESFL